MTSARECASVRESARACASVREQPGLGGTLKGKGFRPQDKAQKPGVGRSQVASAKAFNPPLSLYLLSRAAQRRPLPGGTRALVALTGHSLVISPRLQIPCPRL